MLKNAIWLFVISVFVLFVFLPSYTNLQDLKQRNWEYQRELEVLRAKNAYLTEEMRLLREEPEYLEKVAREKMGLIKEGEVVYQITPIAVE